MKFSGRVWTSLLLGVPVGGAVLIHLYSVVFGGVRLEWEHYASRTLIILGALITSLGFGGWGARTKSAFEAIADIITGAVIITVGTWILYPYRGPGEGWVRNAVLAIPVVLQVLKMRLNASPEGRGGTEAS